MFFRWLSRTQTIHSTLHATFTNSRTHLQTNGTGCLARCQSAHLDLILPIHTQIHTHTLMGQHSGVCEEALSCLRTVLYRMEEQGSKQLILIWPEKSLHLLYWSHPCVLWELFNSSMIIFFWAWVFKPKDGKDEVLLQMVGLHQVEASWSIFRWRCQRSQDKKVLL